jgi:hypothetical protein
MRLRRLIVLGIAVGATFVVWRRVRTRRQERPEQIPFAAPARASVPWVDAVDGACPASHPVKVKVSSGIYHLPGGQFYDRTRPERCYADAAAAEADGYRAAKVGSAARSSA